MIILAVDYGDARTGIAVCDKFEMMASPVTTISEWNKDKLIDKIIELIKDYKAELLVVGLPKNMDSSLGSRAEKCSDFAKELSEKSGLECIMRDERLTTVSAYVTLNENNVRGKKRKDVVDQISAVNILQDYIDFRRLHKNGESDNG